MRKLIPFYLMILMLLGSTNLIAQREVNPNAKQFKFSSTIEKERPELDSKTRELILTYRREPTAANYEALKKQVEKNYDNVIERKKAKLEELKKTARNYSKIEEMEDIVEEVISDREHRIAQTMARFTDSRMTPAGRGKINGYLPLIGAGENIYIAPTPVTNKEWAEYDKDFSYKKGEENFPVVNISLNDAINYCNWLSSKDSHLYRLPTEDEWEMAAGHMPKDADFNCGEGDELKPVDAYKQTLGACGGIDFWGNCWEWTSTIRTNKTHKSDSSNINAVKGGSWDSPRMSCRTEYREEGRNADGRYANVGFRVVMER